MNLLSEFDAAVLRAAWRVLDDLEHAAYRTEPEPDDFADLADAGRLAGTADQAGDAVANVLNAASSYLRDERAGVAISDYGPPSTSTAIAELRAVLEQLPDEAMPS